jgi:hypothetical protein
MGLSLLLTWIFGASVEVQAGVCTTAALALITNSCLAVAIVDWNRRRGPWYARFSWRYFFVTLLFACMTVAVIIKQPAGLLMAAGFVFPVFVASIIPRRTSAQALPAA